VRPWFRHKPRQLIVAYYLHWTTTFEISFSGSSDFRHKPQQLIVGYYLHWTTMFEISFSGSSDFRHKPQQLIVANTTYTGPPCLRYLFQVVHTQTTRAYKILWCRILIVEYYTTLDDWRLKFWNSKKLTINLLTFSKYRSVVPADDVWDFKFREYSAYVQQSYFATTQSLLTCIICVSVKCF
jgi:hypothetical protein